ncbi:MAG: helix-turn-helix domain-containing protein [Bacteroidota bacterium]
MEYHTYPPPPDLLPFVKCYWTLEASEELKPERQRIVPDGCMEMIFQCGDVYKQYTTADTFLLQPRSFVFGQITQTLEIEPTGNTQTFAVRFHPDGFKPFATIPLSAMENRAVPLEELFGADGLELETTMLAAHKTEERMIIAANFLHARLQTPYTIDKITQECVSTILALHGQLSVGALSETVNVHRRQLERKFADAIGLSPKQLAKMIRLQTALKQLAGNPGISLTELAHEGLYYDQAHFIKDFKEFTGTTPKQFYGGRLLFTSLFSE